MRPDCRKRMKPILGRSMMAEEERAIDRRMRRAVKHLKQTDPTWGGLNKEQRLQRAAALAGDSFEQELAPHRMKVPAKSKPLSEDVRKAEADRQRRADELGFTIKAVRGVRLVSNESNPVDGMLTGGRWFTDRPETANTYSGEFGGGMATASMKVRLRLRNPVVIDAGGARFDRIPRDLLPKDVQKEAVRGKTLTTDDIADAARMAEGNYDGIIFKNLKDDLTSNAITTKPATVYAVFDRKNIRSEFAQFDPARAEDVGLLYQSKGTAPTYYSALTNFVTASQQPKAPASQWKAILSKAPGVKAEEIEWTGVNDWLDAQEGSVTREDLVAFLEQNGVKVEEVVKGAPQDRAGRDRILLPLIEERTRLSAEYVDLSVQDWTQEIADRMEEIDQRVNELFNEIEAIQRGEEGDLPTSNATKWSSWTLPGGQSYREMLLTLPGNKLAPFADVLSNIKTSEDIAAARKYQGADFNLAIDGMSDQEILALARKPASNFNSSHWSEPNVLAHVRFKERVMADGQRTLALEEIQSDWHQAGRKQGYAEPTKLKELKDRVDATKAAQSLAEQELIAAISDPSVVAVARNSGSTSNERETLQMVLDGIRVSPANLRMLAMNNFRNPKLDQSVRDRLKAAIEAAEKANSAAVEARMERDNFTRSAVPDAPFKNNAWANLVLKRMIRWAAENGFDSVSWIPGNIQNGQEVDAEDGRSDFYDKIIPNLANKLGKKYGARVEKVEISLDAAPAKTGWEVAGEQPAPAQPARTEQFWSLPITEEMRKDALEKGFALFQRGDPKGWGETTPPSDLPPMRLNLAYTRDAYGDDAVKRLPAPIRERAASGSSIQSLLETIASVKKTLKRKPPKTLTKWISAKRRGYGAATVSSPTAKGINGIKGAAGELRAMGLENLINEKSGTDLDYVREAAIEDGFLQDGASINDLLAAMDREARGDKVYSRHDAAEVNDLKAAEAWEKMFDDAGINIFEDSDKDLRRKLGDFVSSQNDDAVTPDQAAEKFGFGSGEELLNALANVGNRERYIAEQVRREMQQEFGDPFNDGTLTEKARVMAESELRARAGEIELEALARAVGEVAATRMAKEMARDTLQHLTVKELGNWRRYLQAERREMQNAMDAVKRGDTVQAFIHKRRQMVNMHLAREGEKLFEQIEKQRKDLQKYETSKGRRDRIANDYLEKIDAILEHYELRASKQGPKEQRRRMSAALWVKQMQDAGRDSEIPAEAHLLAELADAKVWRDLTSEEVEYLTATIQNLAHLGRTKERLLNEREQRRFSAVVDDLVTTLEAAPTNRPREQSFTPTSTEKATHWLRKVHARLTRMEFEFIRLDGNENGSLFNILWRPFTEAADRETLSMRSAAERMNALYTNFAPGERRTLFNRRVATPEIRVPGKGLTMMDVITIGLNWGNEGNRAALLNGYGWEEAAVEAMLNRVLTDKHWDFIEGVWEMIGSYRDEAFALEKSITGVQPKAVEGVIFKLANGRTIQGKYYPLKYDGAQAKAKSVTQARLDEKDMLSDLGKTFSKPMTKTGHLKERVGSGGKPVKLSIGVFHEHVQNVIHDISYRRAVIDAHKIIQNERFSQAYINAAGREQYDMLKPWLAAIATERNEEPGGWATEIMRRLRRNFSIVAMGWKVGTATQQVTGVLAGPTLIGSEYTARGFLKAMAGAPGSFWAAWKWVSEKSEFMRDRPMGFDRDVRMVTNRMQERTPLGAVQRNAFILIGTMDTAVSTAVWIGAYEKAMDGKIENIASGMEEDAIAYADSVIRRTQVAGRMQDLPQMMRGTELEKLMTMVYSYFSGLYNLTAAQVQQVRGGQLNPVAFAANMSLLFIVIPLMAEFLAGRFPPDDEDEAGEKAAKALASNAVSTVPFLRDVVNASMNPQFGYNMSPAGSIIERTIKGVTGAADGVESDYEARLLLDSFGTIFGLPTGQIWVTGDYIWDLMQGEENPADDPVDAAREAVLRDTR